MARYIDAEELKRKLIDEKGFFPAIVARAIKAKIPRTETAAVSCGKLNILLINNLESHKCRLMAVKGRGRFSKKILSTFTAVPRETMGCKPSTRVALPNIGCARREKPRRGRDRRSAELRCDAKRRASPRRGRL